MSSAQKIPFARSMSAFAKQKAVDEIIKRGQALPGHVVAVTGSIVTVSFNVSGVLLPQVTMPVAGSEYIRLPIQVGDKGVAFPASVYLGGVSGLGGGTADTTQQANLTTLVWFPIGNTSFSAVDANAVTAYGPNGVVLKDSGGNTTLTLTPSGVVLNAQTSITLEVGSHSIVINSSGVTIDGKPFLPHTHSGVTTGGGVSGPVH